MILRALQQASPHAETSAHVPAWPAVEASQRNSAAAPEFWLITQPAHAALSGEMAAQFDPALFPGLDSNVTAAISLHDAGWGPYDAAVIQPLAAVRSKGKPQKPYSFIDAPLAETVAAWTGSIDIAAKSSALGGLLVSLHFCAIAQMKPEASPDGRRTMEQFLNKEQSRQQGWRKKLGAAGVDERVQPLVEALQLCDLLSLYLSAGLRENVEFPQRIWGKPVRLSRTQAGARLEPSPFRGEHLFSISGLRYPRVKEAAHSAVFSLALG